MSVEVAHARLQERFTRLIRLEEAAAFLSWDTAVMMPHGGADSRVEQKAVLQTLHHELLTASEVEAWLDEAESVPHNDPWVTANLHEMRRKWIHATAVPSELVEAVARAESCCEMHWREACAAANFAQVAPSLTELVSLVRQVALTKSEQLGCLPYEALLDQYEPGGRTVQIDALFAEIEDFLPALLDTVLTRQQRNSYPQPPTGPFSVEHQRQLGIRFMIVLGFDFDHGRLDVSHHPFCGGTCDDLRITTRYDTADFTSSLMGILHETGHALYERGLPRAWRWQPVGRACSMSLHESQSLMIEMQVCRSREFITYAAPLIRATFADNDPAWKTDNLYRYYTWVEPGFIRIDADEVTYPVHVILRYRLEQALVTGSLAVADLPVAWNEAMSRLLGITPPDDRLGCLQDIHWYAGTFGYFPTYTLGAMMAAQLFDAACRAEPILLPSLASGDFTPLLAWLRSHVHEKGASLTTDDLLTAATGGPLSASVFRAHLKRRYLDE